MSAALPASLLLYLSLLLRVGAQIAPSCPSNLTWMENDDQQDPCHVFSYLLGQCLNEILFNLTALGDAYAGYAGPTSTDPSEYEYNQCLCSLPVYGVVAACEDCQSKTPVSFSAWTASCNSSFTGSSQYPVTYFPQPVPVNTSIPDWAYIPYSGNQTWSEAAAYRNATGHALSSTSSSQAATSTSATAQPTGGSGGSSGSSSGGGRSSNAGAIAGGVVGGLALIGLIGAGAWFIRRRYGSGRAGDNDENGADPTHPPKWPHGEGPAAWAAEQQGMRQQHGSSIPLPHSPFTAGLSQVGTPQAHPAALGWQQHQPRTPVVGNLFPVAPTPAQSSYAGSSSGRRLNTGGSSQQHSSSGPFGDSQAPSDAHLSWNGSQQSGAHGASRPMLPEIQSEDFSRPDQYPQYR